MTTAITLKDIIIHPIVEQQAPFFDPLEFSPTLTQDVLDQNRSWLQPTFIDPAGGRVVLCIQGFRTTSADANSKLSVRYGRAQACKGE
jgi:hypothetical protein